MILLNGTSSAGKSTLAVTLRPMLPETFCFYSSDQLADADFRPSAGAARWEGREAFFAGFHRSIAAFAEAGLDLLVEHIVERSTWGNQLRDLLSPFDTFWVGVHVPLTVLEQREQFRGDRSIGEAREHFGTHDYCVYDLEVEGVEAPAIAKRVAHSWSRRHGQ
ncbi:chloramphenicol phosphotransferase CPT family protein [Sphingomonas yunnanensis]|uniref:chloramphenicol phosphotransferase CPT family protein n=1 Tax=Sphingomonas yunnanensis TaxID=310400 RepID=UPI001CA6FD3A|nr:chloramphenicol phosphotransferase CPT family protein [Sphingomonas yunnanensis]